jgi:hypothetical protein
MKGNLWQQTASTRRCGEAVIGHRADSYSPRQIKSPCNSWSLAVCCAISFVSSNAARLPLCLEHRLDPRASKFSSPSCKLIRMLASTSVHQIPGTSRFVFAVYVAYSSPNSSSIILSLSRIRNAKRIPKRDQVRRSSDPIRKDKHLAKRIEKERRVHRVADAVVDAIRDELMMFTDLKRDGPVRSKVRVRPVEEPEANHEAYDPGDERINSKRIPQQTRMRAKPPRPAERRSRATRESEG